MNSYSELVTILNEKKIIMFGTGQLSQEVSTLIQSVDYYVDNNEEKWNVTFNAKVIRDPATLLKEDKNNIFIIVSSSYFDEIAEQLTRYGFIQNIHFVSAPRINYIMCKESIDNISTYKDIHYGKRAFIIGNGPSLTFRDLEFLKNEITFASNKIYRGFHQTDWRPTYFTIEDSLITRSINNEIKDNVSSKIFSTVDNFIPLRHIDNIQWIERIFEKDDCNNSLVKTFSSDLRHGYYSGYTVTYFSMQLAYYMGIKEIYLIGLDYNYQNLPSNNKALRAKYVKGKEHDNTYFITNYNYPGEVNYLPYLDLQYQAYCTAAKFFKDNKVKIYNASRSTKLDVFPLINFDSLF